MFQRIRRDNRGFSIAELVVASAISAMILAVIYTIYVSNFNLWDVGNEQADLQAKCRLTINSMVEDIREATRTSNSTPPNATLTSSSQFNYYLPTMSGSNVSLSGDAILWDTGTQRQYIYDSANTRMKKLVGGVETIIAQNVTSASFADQSTDGTLARDEVKITLSLQKTTMRGKVITVSSSSRVKLRN